MKKIIALLALIIAIESSAQKKDSLSKPASTPPNMAAQTEAPSDTTALICLKDINALLEYLSDKMIAKEYLVVQDGLNQLYTQRFREWIDKRKKVAK